jgi:uncharacterized protein
LRAIFPFGASTDLDRHGITQNGTLQSGFLCRYTAITPEAGHDERSWAAIPVGMQHPGAFDRYEPQVLRYESDPVPHGGHLAGPAELVLPLRSTALDSHLQARLSLLSGRGQVHVLAVGWLSAAHRQVDEARSTPSEISHRLDTPAALVPRRTEVLRFSLTPFAQLLDPGGRLRLELGSDPRLLAPSDDFVSFEVAGLPHAARNTVRHQGAELRLSVRPDLP